MTTIIITSYKEPNTIAKAIRSIANKEYSGIPDKFELIQVSPDDETLNAGAEMARALKLGDKYIQIRDPGKGKPHALNLAFEAAQGDVIVLTDGDVYFGADSIAALLKPFGNPKVGGVSGRPVTENTKETMMGYFGNLMADVADKRRTDVMEKSGEHFVSNKSFFPMSGYIMAIRKHLVEVHPEALADDAYMSYHIRNEGFEIAYTQHATAHVKYPTTLKDYFAQKSRSVGGYIQLKHLNAMKKDKQSRSIFIEIPYTIFVLFSYPTSIREFWWSIVFHPIRVATWLIILWERVILKKGMPKDGWKRIETTK